jgi:hypothetical protein
MNAQNHLTANPSVRWNNRDAQQGELKQIVELTAADVYKLERKVHTIKVTQGSAWVVIDGTDYLIDTGREMTIPVRQQRALISSPNGQLVRFEVR